MCGPCGFQPFCCIILGCIAVLLLFKPGCEIMEAIGLIGSEGGPSCDPSPHAWWSSCCSENKVISSQIKILGKSGRCCVPNLGSSFVGASIASIRNTQPYRHPQGTSSSESSNKPELVIQPDLVTIGKNWHFTGATGAVVIKLFHPAHISGFTMVHPAPCEIPPGYEKSAPKCFSVVGMNELEEMQPFHFGNFAYDIEGESAQSFPVEACSLDKFNFLEFRFESNHGNPNYTALYKLEIHGDVGPPEF